MSASPKPRREREAWHARETLFCPREGDLGSWYERHPGESDAKWEAFVDRDKSHSRDPRQVTERVREGTMIRLLAPARAGWFEVKTAFSGSGGTRLLPEGTRLRYVGLMNSPPLGADPLPVNHFSIMNGEHAGGIATQLGRWHFVLEGEE